MPTRWIYGTLGTMSLILAATPAAVAQTPASYNYNRAYRHFLGSRYSYRMLYSPSPGSGSVTYGPFGMQSQFIEPSFSRQQITPYGYARFDVVPGLGGATMTPFGFSSYYVPGFGRGYYAPRGGRAVEYYWK